MLIFVHKQIFECLWKNAGLNNLSRLKNENVALLTAFLRNNVTSVTGASARLVSLRSFSTVHLHIAQENTKRAHHTMYFRVIDKSLKFELR